MGTPQASNFEPWMFYFIEEITTGVKMINCAKIVRDNVDEPLKNLEHSLSFYMSSYVVYSLARCYKYLGLICKGIMGNKKDEVKVYDCYP